ncbi:MAG: tetratricopeptide repeat protein [Chloroflexota bacterium]|nr:tetratricopeptide repeat protein [Chloroflexota bacterium]
MIQNRRWLTLTYLTFLLGFAGIAVFVAAITAEVITREQGRESTLVVVAFVGLCFAGLVFLGWFALVGVLLARQTRQLGSGYGDAYRLIEAFRFREAIPLLERSIREGKETSEVLMLLTTAYAYAGQLAQAQAAADRAVQLYPDDPTAYITLANGYRLQAAYDEAVSTLNQAARLSPDQPTIWAELGFTQRLSGDETNAIASFERAALHAMPAPYAVRVFYHLVAHYQAQSDVKRAVHATARMMSARDGLVVWKTVLKALNGTAYGQALRYELSAIEAAIHDADAGNLG